MLLSKSRRRRGIRSLSLNLLIIAESHGQNSQTIDVVINVIINIIGVLSVVGFSPTNVLRIAGQKASSQITFDYPVGSSGATPTNSK